MSDKAVKAEVENFNKKSLKKTDTVIKQSLPTKEEIEEAKKEKTEES